MSNVQFTPGQFQKFRATTTVHLGPIGRDLVEGQEVEFDGITLKMGGETFSMPTLKGALMGGWIVPSANTQATYQPQAAGVQVHAADSRNRDRQAVNTAVVSQEEMVVGQVGQQGNPRAPNQFSPQRPMPSAHQASPQRQQPTVASVVGGKKVLPNGQTVPAWLDESQLPPWPKRGDYPSEVAFVEASTAYNSAVINAIAWGQQIQKPTDFGGTRHNAADETTGRKVGGGKFTVQAMDGQQGVTIGQVKTSSKSAPAGYEGDPKLREYTFNNDRPPAAVDPQHGESAGTLIKNEGGIRNLQAEVGGGQHWQTPTVQVGSAPSVAMIDDGVNPAHLGQSHYPLSYEDVSVEISTGPELEEILGDEAISTPAPTPWAVVGAPPRESLEEAVKEVVSGWDKNRHWRKRVAEAAEFYADSPEIIEAICEIESPGVAKQIRVAAGLPAK